jgi:hypothetical protein
VTDSFFLRNRKLGRILDGSRYQISYFSSIEHHVKLTAVKLPYFTYLFMNLSRQFIFY